MSIISAEVYKKIQEDFVQNYRKLWIYRDKELIEKHKNDVDPEILAAICSKEWQKQIKRVHHKVARNAKSILENYNKQISKVPNDDILLQAAIKQNYSPFSLCRILLHINYPKPIIHDILTNPAVFLDKYMAANIACCIYNDSFDGPVLDLIRRSIGDDYEKRLKKLATDSGLVFHDEVYLRRYGYDKTPDLKLAVPCAYKGRIISWIESKASFGDMASHLRYVTDQLASYGNRFGTGIVIYWFGYLKDIETCPENGDNIIVANEFPKKEDLTFLDFS